MKTRVALGIATAVACTAAWMVACDSGSPDGNDMPPAESGYDASTSSNNSNSNSSSDDSVDAGLLNNSVDAASNSASTDAGAIDSGTTNLPEIDGGEPSTPGYIACVTPAKFDCDTTTSFCCTTTEKDGGKEDLCDLNNVKCNANGAVEEHCDEAADCDGGAVCCAGNGGKGTVCEAACKGAIQYCRVDSECAADAGCSVLTCNGAPAEVCGHPAGCK